MTFNRFRLRFRKIFVLVAYAILTVVITWPLAAELGQSIPGSGGDAWVHVWTFDWVKDALLSGQNPFYTDRIFYPAGASLLFHNIAWVHIAVWLPLQFLFGDAAAYTLLFLLIYVFNGFATYLFVRELVAQASVPEASGKDVRFSNNLSETAAFIAGLVAAFWPYALSQHNHPNLIFIGWVPLILLYLRRTLQNGRKRDAIITAVFLTLLGYTRWQLLIIGGVVIGLFTLQQLIAHRDIGLRRQLGLLLGSGLLAGLLMAPVLGPLLYAQATRPDPDALFVNESLESTDLLAYVVPSRYHPLWGETAVSFYDNFASDRFTPVLGYTALLLVLVALLTRWRKTWFWLGTAVMLMLLALGPELTINGQPYFQLPYRWVEESFLLKIVRRPDRFNVMLSLPIAVLAGYGAAWLRQQKVRPFLLALIPPLIVAETAVSYPTLAWETPTWYQQRAADPDQYAILGIPAHPRSRFDKSYMFYQLTHNKPLVEGHISRPPSDVYQFIDTLPFMSRLRFGTGTEVPNEVAIAEQLRPLEKAGVRYLVLHKEALSPADLLGWQEWLVLVPDYEDDEVAVYRTNLNLADNPSFKQVLKRDEAGRVEIGLVALTVQPTTEIDRWKIDVVWGSEIGTQTRYDVCFNLTTLDNRPLELRCNLLSALRPSSQWQPNELVRASYLYEGRLAMVEDRYDLVMDLWQPEVGIVTDGKTAVASLQVQPNLNLAATWEDGILLPTYDYTLLAGDNSALELVLHWEANRKVRHNYKRYLHVVDAKSGEIVLQEDVAPDRVAPTEAWERGTMIDDTAYLQLGDLAAGEYNIMIGLYDEQTGERLVAYQENGELYPENSVLLGRVIRQ